MKFGLADNDFNKLVKIAIEPLVKAGAKIWVFGSRARGDYQKFSDLDLYIETNKNLDNLIEKVKEELIDSDLPIKVDLAQSKYFASAYKESLNQDKVLWPL